MDNVVVVGVGGTLKLEKDKTEKRRINPQNIIWSYITDPNKCENTFPLFSSTNYEIYWWTD